MNGNRIHPDVHAGKLGNSRKSSISRTAPTATGQKEIESYGARTRSHLRDRQDEILVGNEALPN
jgi:hypothetical protein